MQMELRRFIIASIRIILLRERIKSLKLAETTLIEFKEHPNTILAVVNAINTLQQRKERLKEYVKLRFDLLLTFKYSYDTDNFSFLTREDIKKGYYILDDQNVFVLSTGEIISLKNAEFGPIKSVLTEFDIPWPKLF